MKKRDFVRQYFNVRATGYDLERATLASGKGRKKWLTGTLAVFAVTAAGYGSAMAQTAR